MSTFDRRQVLLASGALAAASLVAAPASAMRQTDATPEAGGTPAAEAVPVEVLTTAVNVAAAWASGDPPVIVALTDPASFEAAHIPGAVQVDWPELELSSTTPEAIAAWQAETRDLIASLGIAPDSSVVIYSSGNLFAARFWWLLDYFGHDDKLILTGGLPAWQLAGFPVESGAPAATAAATPGAPGPYPDNANENLLATIEQVELAVEEGTPILVDAQPPDEYATLHLPGSINVPFPYNAIPADQGIFLSPEELLALYADAGVTPDQPVITYCSTGFAGSVAYVALKLAGFTNVALYSGNRDEWGYLGVQ